MSSQSFKSLAYQDTIPKVEKAKRLVWEIVCFFAFRPTPRWAFHGWRSCLLRLFGARIGEGCRISPNCRIWAPWNLTIGSHTAIACGVELYSMDKITIGSKVAISQRSYVCTGTHDVTTLRRPLITKPIVIEDHVWICAECFIGPGVILGFGSVTAARSVVVRDVLAWNIVGGNPAKLIKKRQCDE